MTSVVRGDDKYSTQASVRSRVRLRGISGNGSVNTAVRRFTTLVEQAGLDITYADSATLGGSFTINTDGIYAISFTDQYNSASTAIITDSNNNLAGAAGAADILAAGTSAEPNFAAHCSWTGFLAAGTVIRARNFGAGAISGTLTAVQQFSIVRVG